MPRYKRNPSKTSWLDTVAGVPWWAYVVLALGSLVGIRMLAVQQAAAAGPALAWIEAAQIAVPVLGMVCAALSAWRRRNADARSNRALARHAASASQGLSRRDFEQRLGEAFRRQGYQVVENSGLAAGAPEMTLRKERATYLVHLKHWQTPKVGVDALQALHATTKARAVGGEFVVTTGRFSREAQAFAKVGNIRLIDGASLQPMIAPGGRNEKPLDVNRT